MLLALLLLVHLTCMLTIALTTFLFIIRTNILARILLLLHVATVSLLVARHLSTSC